MSEDSGLIDALNELVTSVLNGTIETAEALADSLTQVMTEHGDEIANEQIRERLVLLTTALAGWANSLDAQT